MTEAKTPFEKFKEHLKVTLRSEDEILEAMFLLLVAQPEGLSKEEQGDLHIAGGALMWALQIDMEGFPNAVGDAIDALKDSGGETIDDGPPPPLVQIYSPNDLRNLEDE